MDYGALTAARLRSGQWLHWGIRFFLAAALTASETVDGYAPFALGCIAAAGPGAGGAAALGGGVMGALLFLPFQQALAFAAVGILTVTAATAFRDTDFFKRPWVMPVLAAGMVLGDGLHCLPAGLQPLGDGSSCLVTLREGKYHQVKRMLAARGKPVTALHRLSMGPLKLEEELKPGQWRTLTENEIAALRGEL